MSDRADPAILEDHAEGAAEAAFAAFVARATADPDVLGLVLMGSRAVGTLITDESDFDVIVIVGRDPARWRTARRSAVEAWSMTIEEFRVHGLTEDSWNRPAFLGASCVLDRLDGEIAALIERKRSLDPAEARAVAAAGLGAYLDSLYRSLRNLEAGRDLEGRLDALDSIDPLLTASFALEGRVRPFNKWLRVELADRPLAFVDVLFAAETLSQEPTAGAQRRVFRHVEFAARVTGHGDVVDDWAPDVDWLRGGPPIVPEMTAADVGAFLELMDRLGVGVWIDGGWAVDASLGRQTRRHADLDIVIEERDLDTVVQALTARGYGHVPRDDTRPWNFVRGDEAGHEIDFHVIVRDAAGRGAYGPAEIGDAYPAEALAGAGSINGRAVACIAPEWLVRFHTGYPLAAKDRADVAALCARFGIPLPAGYENDPRP